MGEIHSSSEKLDLIERAFGKADIFNKGNVQVKCPKCYESHQRSGVVLKKRKLAINILKGDLFHCWFCGYKGRLSRALKEYASSALLIEYLKRFADSRTLSVQADENEVKKKVRLPPDYKLLILNKKRKNSDIMRALSYARERGLTDHDLWYFKIGISNEWPWVNRLLFPSFNEEGDFNYMVGRSWLVKPQYPYWDTPIDASSVVFNETNIDWESEITITEGVMDLVKCNENAVPVLGSDLVAYSALFGRIVQYGTPVLLAMDQDMVYKKMPGIVKLFLKAGIRVRVLNMDGFNDVGDMTKEEFDKKRMMAQAWDQMSLLRHKIDSIGSGRIL